MITKVKKKIMLSNFIFLFVCIIAPYFFSSSKRGIKKQTQQGRYRKMILP